MNTALLCLGAGAMTLLGSCVSYKDSPIDLVREEQAWKQQSLAVQGTKPLNLGKIQKIGLVLNADLNQARLKLAHSSNVAQQSGWWNDPSISFDAKQSLEDVSVINLDAGLTFTIPVTGIPSLEKKTAEQYKESDYWALRQAELTYLSTIEQEWKQLGIVRKRKELIAQRVREMKDEDARFSQLYKLGEIDAATRQLTTKNYNTAVRDLQTAEQDELAQRMSLIKQAGLHPAAASVFRLDTSCPMNVPKAVTVPSPGELVSSPQIKSGMAAYAADEIQLKTEIRRQFPELELGPAFTRDDGEKELGGSIGFNIPLWNHNRKAIAEAEGTRNSSRQATIALWRELLQNSRELAQEQQLVRSHCQDELNRLNLFSSNLVKLEQLYKIGETSLADLAEARQQVYESRISFLDSLSKLTRTQTSLRYLIPPSSLAR